MIPFIEIIVLRAAVLVGLPLAATWLWMGPARFRLLERRAWEWLTGSHRDPQTILARILERQRARLDRIARLVEKSAAAETEVHEQIGHSERTIANLQVVVTRAREAESRIGVEGRVLAGFRRQLEQQQEQTADLRRRLHEAKLELRQFEVGRTILLSRLAAAERGAEQQKLLESLDACHTVADWRRAEGMVLDKVIAVRAAERVRADLADVAGDGAAADPVAGPPEPTRIEPARAAEDRPEAERTRAAAETTKTSA